MEIFNNSDIIHDETIAKIGVVSSTKPITNFREYENALFGKVDDLLTEYIKYQKTQASEAGEPFDEESALYDIATRVGKALDVSIEEISFETILGAIMASPNYTRFTSDIEEKFSKIQGFDITLPNKNVSEEKGISNGVAGAILRETDLFAFLEALENYEVPNINFIQTDNN